MEENTPNHEEVFKSRKKGTFTLFIHYLCVFPLQLKTHIFTYTNQQSPICIHLQLSETKIDQKDEYPRIICKIENGNNIKLQQ